MKLRAVFAILASLLAASVFAQMPPPGPPMDMDRMALLLDLDGYQKTEVKKLLDAQRTEMDARRKQFEESGQRPTRDVMRAEREKSEKAMIESLQQILNELQIAKFKALTEGPRPNGPPPGERRGEGGRRPQ
jgi:hypothetical protein